MRTGNYQYIEAPKPELYDLAKDPAERTNLFPDDNERVRTMGAELGTLLTRYAKAPVPSGSTNPETERLLASLGYLSHGPNMRHPMSGANPKDRLPEFHVYERAVEKVGDRDLNGAILLLKQVLSHDETNTLARRDLASCYLDLHAYRKALTNFEQVARVAPQDYPSQFGLGLAAKHVGLTDEARHHLEIACKLAPEASQCQAELGDLLRSGGVGHNVHNRVIRQQP
jgi:tetratricopeptide (TPR) repeat protein